MSAIAPFRIAKPVRLALVVVFLIAAFFLLQPQSFPETARISAGRLRSDDIVRFINPLIGTVNGGHVFPGPSLPYGMAKPCPDTDSRAENAAGYVSDDAPVLGFSQLHDSGMAHNPSFGNFPIFVHPGCPENDPAKCQFGPDQRKIARVNDSARASPGYFSLGLVSGVHAEMTATMHANLFRFTTPGTPQTDPEQNPRSATPQSDSAIGSSPLVLIEVTDLMRSRSAGAASVDVQNRRMSGWGQFRPSFGSGSYSAYFCADVRGGEIIASGIFNGPNVNDSVQAIDDAAARHGGGYRGVWMQFKGTQSAQDNEFLVRVGMSFMSVEQACQNAEREIPDFEFAKTHRAAEQAWREKLSSISVNAEGVSNDMRTVFWSGLYRSLLSPQNYTGENQLWESSEPYFDSFYCIWDSFRAQHPLLTIIDPEAQTEMIRALIDIFKFEGKLPDCRMQFSKGYTQGGSNADIVIADAYIKNLHKGINWTFAYDAVVSDAEVVPRDWGLGGRGNLDSWFQYGYIASDHKDHLATGPHSRTVSRTVEYAYDDFCIAHLSRALGRVDDEKKYMNRSGFWKNLWNPDQADIYTELDGKTPVEHRSGFTGFLMPRKMDGSFIYQPVRTCSPVDDMHRCYYDTALHTYEGSPWLYTFFVPQNMAGLISTLGGREAFIQRLHFFHESGIAYMGNEQSFLTVYQFHYGGRPALSAHWVNRYIPAQFNASINGIPGNDDCAMGAFSSMAMMGFFPVAGQSVYLLSVPFFKEVRLRSYEGARDAVITRVGEGKYVQSATLNGQAYTKNWISHEFFQKGGALEIVAGEYESEWGTKTEDLPPSYEAVPMSV
ncbi:hypothetical protein TD95_000292 [Thielaviopsis punctulata]|uniref:Glycosyl hydrolase family 92 domain-containing protein n=1 Tax=Thielaviopsis punctulata TaxID=72032 RepID=A0A0F4ZFG1_9PEZI|nr:hypothetical protein TD95_000292 [Thielaviopsis punctulata]